MSRAATKKVVRPLLIWTRSLQHWEEDIQLFSKTLLKNQVLHLPAITTVAMKPSKKFLKNPPNILCFTSRAAVTHVLATAAYRRVLKGAERVFTFSTSAAAALRFAGVKVQKLPAENGKAFAQALRTKLRPTDRIGILTAKKPAFDLAVFLKKQGYKAKNISIYTTQEKLTDNQGDLLRKPDLSRLLKQHDGVICFASPSAVRSFHRGVGNALTHSQKKWIPVCIGQTTGKAARRFFSDTVVLMGEPSLKNLLRAAQALLRALAQPERNSHQSR